MSIVVCNEECEGDLLAKNPVFLSSLTTQNGTDIAQKHCEGSVKNILNYVEVQIRRLL